MAVITNIGIELTPRQFATQWRNIPHKFQVNLWNFEVKAGKAVREDFHKSFEIKRFNDSGSLPWANRSKLSKAKHPLMVQTGSLRDSIKWKHTGERTNPSGLVVYTDPDGFNHTARHQGFCYAAVHNGPDKFRRGRVRNMPRRQFMGYSTVAEDSLMKLATIIFKGFPK